MSIAYTFTDIIARQPGESVVRGLRSTQAPDPDYRAFLQQFEQYIDALRRCGVEITLLEPLDAFPDSVFVEDAALCIQDMAILTRPGAPSRSAEAATLESTLMRFFAEVITLPGSGFLDGGDVLVTEKDVFVGLSARTNQEGIDALGSLVQKRGYTLKQVNTPPNVLHLKTACGLLDSSTLFCTADLASTGCFEGYDLIIALQGEEAAANLIRVNDFVLISSGFAETHKLLASHGYRVIDIDTTEAAKIDAGLSCMSIRFALNGTG